LGDIYILRNIFFQKIYWKIFLATHQVRYCPFGKFPAPSFCLCFDANCEISLLQTSLPRMQCGGRRGNGVPKTFSYFASKCVGSCLEMAISLMPCHTFLLEVHLWL